MPYPMVHLKVAYGLLARWGDTGIEEPGDFLLGCVAPDAVHFHDSYDVSLKEKSHLWEFGPHWGVTLDSEGWHRAALTFWKENKDAENRDFMAGYCTHILTDWENDRSIWSPFREKLLQNINAGFETVHEQYAAEAHGMDQWLYQTDENSREIWRLLAQGRVYGVEGRIFKEDLARQKWSLLNEQFTGKSVCDVNEYRFCTKEIMHEFVDRCVENIYREMKEYGFRNAYVD